MPVVLFLSDFFGRQGLKPGVVVAHDILAAELARSRDLSVHLVLVDGIHRIRVAREVQPHDLDCVHLPVDTVDGAINFAESTLANLPHVGKLLLEAASVEHARIVDRLLGLFDLLIELLGTVGLAAKVEPIDRLEVRVLGGALRAGRESLSELESGPLVAAAGDPLRLRRFVLDILNRLVRGRQGRPLRRRGCGQIFSGLPIK